MTSYQKIKSLFNAKERRHILYLLLGIIVMSLLEVAGIASIIPFMAVVSNPEMIHENIYLNFCYQYFGFTSDRMFLIGSGILVLVTLVFTNSYNAIMNWWIAYFTNIQGHYIAKRLLAQYLFKPYLFFLNRNTADLGKNILTEVPRIVGGVILPGIMAISKLVTALFIFILLLFVDPFLAISVAVALSCVYWLLFRFVRVRLHRIGTASTKVIFQRFKIANEALLGIKDIKLHGSELEFLRRFSSPSMDFAKYNAHHSIISLLPRHVLEVVAIGGVVTIVLYFITNVSNKEHVIPLMSLYAFACYRLMPAIQLIYQGVVSVRYNFPALEILVEDLSNNKPLLKEVKLAKLSFERLLQLKSVDFCYPNVETPVIGGLNLDILPNTSIGFVGGTGSGKTTLVDIILGLLSPIKGDISVDGVKITQENISEWQKKLGYVPQSIYLADDTIERNIAFAIPDDEIDIERVIYAAKLAEIDDFVLTLSDGYQTSVGEQGVRLSGGQRQRIGIARALYSNPKVLILDEATSALDGITEDIIMGAINKFLHKKTVIIVAHRLATVKGCDVIHLMDKGRIVDSGSYDELIRRNTQFQKMAQV